MMGSPHFESSGGSATHAGQWEVPPGLYMNRYVSISTFKGTSVYSRIWSVILS